MFTNSDGTKPSTKRLGLKRIALFISLITALSNSGECFAGSTFGGIGDGTGWADGEDLGRDCVSDPSPYGTCAACVRAACDWIGTVGVVNNACVGGGLTVCNGTAALAVGGAALTIAAIKAAPTVGQWLAGTGTRLATGAVGAGIGLAVLGGSALASGVNALDNGTQLTQSNNFGINGGSCPDGTEMVTTSLGQFCQSSSSTPQCTPLQNPYELVTSGTNVQNFQVGCDYTVSGPTNCQFQGTASDLVTYCENNPTMGVSGYISADPNSSGCTPDQLQNGIAWAFTCSDVNDGNYVQ